MYNKKSILLGIGRKEVRSSGESPCFWKIKVPLYRKEKDRSLSSGRKIHFLNSIIYFVCANNIFYSTNSTENLRCESYSSFCIRHCFFILYIYTVCGYIYIAILYCVNFVFIYIHIILYTILIFLLSSTIKRTTAAVFYFLYVTLLDSNQLENTCSFDSLDMT